MTRAQFLCDTEIYNSYRLYYRLAYWELDQEQGDGISSCCTPICVLGQSGKITLDFLTCNKNNT